MSFVLEGMVFDVAFDACGVLLCLDLAFDAQYCLCQVSSRPPAFFLKPVPSIFPNSSDGVGLLSVKRKDMVWVC